MLKNHVREETPVLEGRHPQRVLRHPEKELPHAHITAGHKGAVRGVLGVQGKEGKQAQGRHTDKARALHEPRQTPLQQPQRRVRVAHGSRQGETGKVRVREVRKARRDVQVVPGQGPNRLHARGRTLSRRAVRGPGKTAHRGHSRRR